MIKEVVLDTETTGLSIEKDRIVEIACIELDNHLPTNNLFHTFLNPEGVKVSKDAFEIHGYSNEFLNDKPKFKDIAKNFLQFIEGKKIIIHNADFDLSFLNKELKKLNFSEIDKNNVLDSLLLAREKHSALLDCKLLSKVYFELVDDREFKFMSFHNDKDIERIKNSVKSASIIVKPSLNDLKLYEGFLKKNIKL